MDIILLQDLDKVGYKHDIVKVKPGFGRNFLIPQGKALIANKANREKLDGILKQEAAKEAARVDEYKAMAENLAGKTLKIGVKAGTSGKIFGSVTNVQVANALLTQLEMEVERKKIELPVIKTLGSYKAIINFYQDITSEIDIELVQEYPNCIKLCELMIEI